MKNYGDSLENPIFRGKFIKNYLRFKEGLGKKEGVLFLKGGVDTPMHTMKLDVLLHET